MKKIAWVLALMITLSLFSSYGVYAYDADNPYTVTMNFIVGDDTSFTVGLAGVETTIDFNPASKDSKLVEPDSQNSGESTPIATITNTGNVNLDFSHILNETLPATIVVYYNTANSVDGTKFLSEESTTVSTSVAPAGESTVYLWANFTNAASGTTSRDYQINSTISA